MSKLRHLALPLMLAIAGPAHDARGEGLAPDDLDLAHVDAPLDRSVRAPTPKGEPAAAATRRDLDGALGQLPPGVRAAPPDAAAALSIEYTVDPALDARVREILEEGGVALGQVIALDPATGDVFAYVTTDPEAFPAARAYPTASLMKLVTAAAVLRDAPAAAERTCHYHGSPYLVGDQQLAPPRVAESSASFEDALAISNNQCFARLAVHDLGRDALLAEIERVGLLASPGPGHPSGRVEAVDDALALGRLGSGLAGSFLSPLAAVRLAAALADGELVRPRWVARVRDVGGELVAAPGPAPAARIGSPELARALRASLVGVTERGTARRAFRDEDGKPLLGDVAVAGKTGTLRGDQPEALYQWFVGVAPADEPRLALAVLVAHDLEAKGELTSAAQVAARTLHEMLCDGEACDAARVEPLLAAARARDVESAAELRAQAVARAKARAAAEAVEPPRLVEAGDLEFPRRLRRRRTEGEIVLVVSVARSGDVARVAVDASDLPRFDDFVSEAVREWKFEPGTRGGEPIPSQLRLRIPIRIE